MKTGIRIFLTLSLALGFLYSGSPVFAQPSDTPPYTLSNLEAIRAHVLHEMRLLTAAKDQLTAQETIAPDKEITWVQLHPYLMPTMRLALLTAPADLLGNPIHLGKGDQRPQLSPKTIEALKIDRNEMSWAMFCPKPE